METASIKIVDALRRAELEIRELGAQAFRTADDGGVTLAREAVETLKSLRARLEHVDAPKLATPNVISQENRLMVPTIFHPTARKAATSGYPRYEVRNSALIRIGWSKKNKAEYEHKVPHLVFERTVDAMSQLAKSGPGPFTAEHIIQHSSRNTDPIPSYQIYVVLGILRDRQCVEQVGRDGYIIPANLEARAAALWGDFKG